jgi:hypothetical protein
MLLLSFNRLIGRWKAALLLAAYSGFIAFSFLA